MRPFNTCLLTMAFLIIAAGPVLITLGEEQEEPRVDSHPPIYYDGSSASLEPPEGMTGNGTGSDPYLISGFWLNTTDSPGIEIVNSTDHIVVDFNLFTGGVPLRHPGISIVNSTNVTIRNVATYYCTRGIEIINSSGIIVSDSGFFGSYDGIYIEGRGIIVERVLCKVNVNNGILVNRSGNIVLRNVISESNTAILGITAGIHIVDSNDIDIIETTCSLNYGYGVIVEPSNPSVRMERIRISGSYIDTNNNGIMMTNVDDSVIEDSTLQYNTNGLLLSFSAAFRLEDCWVYKNTYGAFLSDSSEVEILGSDFDRNENAVYLDSTRNSTISNNRFTNGTWHAITIDTWLDMGPPSRFNRVHDNEFRLNGPIGCQVMDNGENNSWSEGTSGNLWSDHWGPDADNDSIVDEPYVIDGLANATDPYPRAFEKEDSRDIDEKEEPSDEEEKDDGELFWLLMAASGGTIIALGAGILVFTKGGRDRSPLSS
ncbi:MAG: nitrous oxide reductase family maturation protein NosD [Thermoplasmatota archaeon]